MAAGLFADRRVSVPPEAQTSFFGRSFISVDQIQSSNEVNQLFEMADVMAKVTESNGVYRPLVGYGVTELFYEASTRTSLSFEAAAKRLGAKVHVRDGMGMFSSVTKGESLQDTIHAACQTTGNDLIVLRHKEDRSSEVAAKIAARYGVPIINAGSGSLEHPTQALLDLYTIKRLVGRTERLKVMMVGDLLYGRTIKSLAKLLAIMDPQVELVFASPQELAAPADFVEDISSRVGSVEETDEFLSALPEADVVYWTRVQKERFPLGQEELYDRVKDQFIFRREHIELMKEHSILMHPLPRVNEIDYAVDKDPHGAYFRQMRSGLYIRMALMHEILLGHQIVA
ncbi:aspartate carbamoyltransferase [Candidatus Cerribacteria bacterium 'Amazon FNV 2010 28 9']|uniref:Aspartate carbamoyltransferase n=1 Tax=Candidatus Cerribacteria bacterium 'Amazon FNV 2010 28 9' TaxID=2081795 RepID=A0A317JPS4_9BACT|nr:MAG: aspartate carbamoyltransferase [Candidatus Cerribacteria bacterium 'Amazon FNV 2010 28 9']